MTCSHLHANTAFPFFATDVSHYRPSLGFFMIYARVFDEAAIVALKDRTMRCVAKSCPKMKPQQYLSTMSLNANGFLTML